MDSSVSPKDEIWFLRMRHHISIGLYQGVFFWGLSGGSDKLTVHLDQVYRLGLNAAIPPLPPCLNGVHKANFAFPLPNW